MREDYGSISIEKDNYISTIRDELEHLSDDILTNQPPHNEPIENDGE